MILALGWWTILLFKKNQEITELKTELFQKEGSNPGDAAWHQLKREQDRQGRMIIGESVVFVIMLSIGLYWINRAFHRELELMSQKHNFLLSISHEFKSPLTAVKLGLETLAKRDLDYPKKQQVINQTLQENNRLEKLVNSLLLAAKIESNYLTDPTQLDLKLYLEELIKSIRKKHPEVQITDHFAQHNFPLAMIDQNSLDIIMDNLIENAIKYSSAPAKIEVSLSVNGPNLLLSITDEGAGIPDHEKSKVREKFYRSGSEETRNTQGTGLGLYLVDKLCAANHCSLDIRDHKPRGTLIELNIPQYSKS